MRQRTCCFVGIAEATGPTGQAAAAARNCSALAMARGAANLLSLVLLCSVPNCDVTAMREGFHSITSSARNRIDGRYDEAKRLGRFSVYGHLEFHRYLHW